MLSIQWRNFSMKSEEDQAKFLTWCTYKLWASVLPLQKGGGPDPHPPKITPMCLLSSIFKFVEV